MTYAEHRRRAAWELLKKLTDDAKRGDYDLVLDPEIVLLACGDEVGQT